MTARQSHLLDPGFSLTLRPMAYPFRALVGFPIHSSGRQRQLHMPQQLPH